MPKILTVSQFIESIRGLFRETLSAVTVQGEVTGYRSARNGTLVYFELKDDTSRVLCFALKHEIKVVLTDGMEVQVTGSPSLFKGNGGFHLRVIDIQLVGEGALRKQFELTKQRLAAEGLFRPERKRALPLFPNTIGIVTSPDAAAYTDVLRILKNRWPLVAVKLAGVAVQGPGAARQIVRAIDQFSTTRSVDVVIVTRGGGSLEDLQAFNDESVARAIFGSSVPVVVGVGHERDETIADYVADQRASTPSNAAERVVPDRSEILHQLDVMGVRMMRSVAGLIEVERGSVASLVSRLSGSLHVRLRTVDAAVAQFSSAIARVRSVVHAKIATIEMMRLSSFRRIVSFVQMRYRSVDALQRTLQSLSPTAILQRGYSITRTARGRIIKRTSDVRSKDSLITSVADGDIHSTVT